MFTIREPMAGEKIGEPESDRTSLGSGPDPRKKSNLRQVRIKRLPAFSVIVTTSGHQPASRSRCSSESESSDSRIVLPLTTASIT